MKDSFHCAFNDKDLTRYKPDAPDKVWDNATGTVPTIEFCIRVVRTTFTEMNRRPLPATDELCQSVNSGKKLANALRKLAILDNTDAAQQVIALEGELSAIETDINVKEAAMNELVDNLYGLSPDDIVLVGKG